MIIIIITALLFSAIWLYQGFAGGIDSVTANIKSRWLKVTLRIIFKIVTLTFIVLGVLATVMFAIILNYKPKKK